VCPPASWAVSNGEHDAWLVAIAEPIDADVVGADRALFERMGSHYHRFR
jgi:hypothetical protein